MFKKLWQHIKSLFKPDIKYSVGGNGVVTVKADDILRSEQGRKHLAAASGISEKELKRLVEARLANLTIEKVRERQIKQIKALQEGFK